MNSYMRGHPIHVASWFGHKSVVERLLRGGASINALARKVEWKDSSTAEFDDLTPLMLASMKHSNYQTVGALVGKGASMTLQDSRGWRALMHAASSNSTRCVSALTAKNCGISMTTTEGFTALMLTAQQGNVACYSVLIEAGAVLTRKDKDGINATRHAYLNRHLEAIVRNTSEAITRNKERRSSTSLSTIWGKLAAACESLNVAAVYLDRGGPESSRLSISTRLIELLDRYNAIKQTFNEKNKIKEVLSPSADIGTGRSFLGALGISLGWSRPRSLEIAGEVSLPLRDRIELESVINRLRSDIEKFSSDIENVVIRIGN